MTTLRLRQAGPGDAERIAALHADSWRRHYRGAYSDAYLDGDVLTERRTTWASRLAEPGRSLTLVAERAAPGESELAETGGAPLSGFVHVVFDEDERWGSLIDNLHVTYARKRSGIGRALMVGAAEAVAERADSKALYLWVLEQNVSAQSFYSALGGTRAERVPSAAPGGDTSRLNGTPYKFRVIWRQVSSLLEAAERGQSRRRSPLPRG